jgi:hypothetical protein
MPMLARSSNVLACRGLLETQISFKPVKRRVNGNVWSPHINRKHMCPQQAAVSGRPRVLYSRDNGLPAVDLDQYLHVEPHLEFEA